MPDISTLLPPNASATERAASRAFDRHSPIDIGIREARRPADCPPELLPWLAWEMSVDNWRIEWSTAHRRQMISASPTMHRRKGSASAVQQALLALGYEVYVQEWFQLQPMGLPYTFQLLLNIDQVGIDQVGMQRVLEVVDSHKNLRSHLTEIMPRIRTRTELVCAAVTGLGHLITLPVDPGGILINEHVLVVA